MTLDLPAIAALLLMGVAIGLVATRLGSGRSAPDNAARLAPVPAERKGTEREEALAAQLATADELGLGLLLVEPGGLIAAANDAAERLLGVGGPTLVGRSTMEAFVDHTMAELVERALAGERSTGEYSTPGEPQATITVRAWAARDGRSWVGLEDVSELRRLRRIRTEFIDNLAHELRTPLTTVRLLSESLAMEAERNELPLPARVRESIAKIDIETGHLAQMINELLDLSKIEQGEAPLLIERIDLGIVIEATVERLRLYAERHGVELRSELAPSPAERAARGDEERIGQLLVNLVHNAIKFSPDGGQVIVRVRPAGGDVVVEVEDAGPGISRRDLERIF
ncbi:hypothetical protein BH24CHL5_BH24CHL5_08980 [soil metagenome]